MTVNVSASLTLAVGYVLADVQDAVEAAISGVFDVLAPGDDWRVLATQAAIAQVDGVLAVSLTPSADQTVLASEVAVVGTVTVT